MPKLNNNDDDHQSAIESRNWINKSIKGGGEISK